MRISTPAVLLAVSLVASAAAPDAPPASPPPPRFPSDVDLVVVDVVVTAKGGAPLAGLRAEDFKVTEDGVPQEVGTFEAIDVSAETAQDESPERRPRVSVNTGVQGMTTRSFVIVFDQVHLTSLSAERAKTAISDFLRFGPREGDTVTIVGTGGGSWWMTRASEDMEELRDVLKRLQGRSQANDSPDRITDWEAMRIWQDRDPITLEQVRRRFETYISGRQRMAEGDPVRGQDRITDASNGKELVPDDDIRNRAQDVYQRSLVSNRTTLSGLSRVLDSLGAVRGRKTVILFSEGFIRDTRLEEYDTVIRSAQRSNAAIYFVDARGLEGMPAATTAQFGALLPATDVATQRTEELVATLGADTLANNTGGFAIKNTNDLGRGLTRIAQETRRYYLLGYVPTNARRDGSWRKIDVKVGRGDVEVRARKGYYAPGSGRKGDHAAAGSWRPGLQQALDSPFEFQAIPVRLTHHLFGKGDDRGQARALLSAEIDVRSLAFAEEAGRSVDTVEFLLVVTHRASGVFQRQDQKLELKLPPNVRLALGRSWLPVSREFDLAPGRYQAKLAVRDTRSGNIGSVSHDFEVPALDGWRTSTPVLSDALEPRTEGAPVRPVIPARRTFAPGATLYFQFEVYGSAPDPASGLPRVSSGFTVRASDGEVISRGAPVAIKPAAEGRLARLGRISLEGLAPGRYELVLDLRDDVAGRTLEVREPFSVEVPSVPVSERRPSPLSAAARTPSPS
jgi:VWFA-related protein